MLDRERKLTNAKVFVDAIKPGREENDVGVECQNLTT